MRFFSPGPDLGGWFPRVSCFFYSVPSGQTGFHVFVTCSFACESCMRPADGIRASCFTLVCDSWLRLAFSSTVLVVRYDYVLRVSMPDGWGKARTRLEGFAGSLRHVESSSKPNTVRTVERSVRTRQLPVGSPSQTTCCKNQRLVL